MRRRWVRRAAISLFAVVALSVGAIGLLFWRLSQGPVSLDFMRERIQAEINKSLGGLSAKLGGVIIERDPLTGMPHFRLRDLELLDRYGQTIARTPKAAFGVDGNALLNFQLLPKQIELIGPRILVRRTLGGSFELGFGPGAAPENGSRESGPPVEASNGKSNRADQAPDFGGIVPATPGRTLVDFLSGALPGRKTSDAAIASLDSVLVSNAAIQLYDEANAATWYAPSASVAFKRMPYGFALFADARIATGQNPWRTEISASYRKETGEFSVSARIFDLVPADLSDEIFALSQLAQVRLPLTGHADLDFGRTGEIVRASAELSAAAGEVGFPGYISQPVLVDEGLVRLDYEPSTGGVVISQSNISVAGVSTAISGRIDALRRADNRLSALKLTIRAKSNEVAAPGSDFAVDTVEFTGVAAVGDPRLDVEDAVIMSGNSGVRMRGAFVGGGRSVGMNLALRFRDMPASMLKRLWPPIVAPDTRSWIDKNISAGRIVDGELTVNLPVDALAEAQEKRTLAPEMLTARLALSGVTAAYVPKLPVIADASGEARLSGDNFELEMNRGIVVLPSGSTVELSNGRMRATALMAERTPGEFHLDASSDVSALLEYMRLDPIKLAPDSGFDATRLKGDATVTLSLALPLKSGIARSDIKLDASARVVNASMKEALDGVDLSGGDLKLEIDTDGVSAKGPVKINGIPATLAWARDPSDGVQSAVIETELDEKERDAVGAHVNDYVRGPVKLKVTLSEFRDKVGKAKVEADLSKAELKLDAVDWVRAPAAKTTASFVYVSGPAPGITGLLVKGTDILVKGDIKLTPKGGFDEANFSTIELGDQNQFGLRLKRGEGLTSVSIAGLSFDARPLIKSMFGSRATSEGAEAGSKGQAYDIQVTLDRVYAHRGEIITGVSGSMFMAGGVIGRADIGGSFESGQPVTFQISPGADGGRQLTISGRDAGAALRAANLYSKVAGGQIDFFSSLGGRARSSVREGRLVIRDFEVRNEAALAKLDRKGKPQSGSREDGVVFKQLNLPFTADARFIRLGETTLKGPQLCATASGLIRKADGAIDIDGTIVPACGINLLPGQIPLLGWLITGGPDEGLFGLTYALGGTLANPGFQVNPVSAVAPGIFRKLFEYGSSSGQPMQRREKTN